MEIRGISHITFVVKDLSLMARFLCQGLGAQEVYDSESHVSAHKSASSPVSHSPKQ